MINFIYRKTGTKLLAPVFSKSVYFFLVNMLKVFFCLTKISTFK